MNAGNIRFKLTRSSLWHILWLGSTRLQLIAGITITRVVLILDVSKYQALINFVKMLDAGVAGVIIKCGQALVLDPFFLMSWAKAKMAGIPRGSYWFYDSRVDPEEQARKWANWLAQDKGELKHWLDLEENYGGKYAGWQNWKKFLNKFMELSKLSPKDIGIYTGYFYWIAHSPTNLADLNWFGQFWLWLAWYTTNPANVKIPKPWTKLKLWQYGTMGVDGQTANGHRYGVESLEVDENNFDGDEQAYADFFGLSGVVTPPPDGGAMSQWYKVTTSVLNIRKGPGASYQDIGNLVKDQLIEVEDPVMGGWLHIETIMTGTDVQALPDPDHSWCSAAYCVKVDPPITPPPTEDDEPVKVTLELKSGKILVADQFTEQ